MSGFVYVLKVGEVYKIGRTGALARRVRQILSELRVSGELIHSIETNDPVAVEKFWHDRFSGKRVRGEWFALGQEDVAEIVKYVKITLPGDSHYNVPESILATRPPGDGWRLERFKRARISDYYQWRRGNGHGAREASYAGAVRRVRETGETR